MYKVPKLAATLTALTLVFGSAGCDSPSSPPEAEAEDSMRLVHIPFDLSTPDDDIYYLENSHGETMVITEEQARAFEVNPQVDVLTELSNLTPQHPQ